MRYPGTDPKKILHRVLVAPEAMEKLPRWLILAVLLLLAAGVEWAWNPDYSPGVMAAAWLVFPLLDWAMLATLPRTQRSFGPVYPPLLSLAILRASVTLLVSFLGRVEWALGAMLIITLLAWYATWIEPFRIQVTQQALTFPQWPASAPPLRLLHLSDLHLEYISLREKKLQTLIDELEPDLICFSGDLLNLSNNANPLSMKQARAVISRWRAPLGVYAVTGSPLVDLPSTAAAILSELPNIHWLQDRAVTLNQNGYQLNMAGLTCTHNPEIDGEKLSVVLADLPNDTPQVLVYHTPDLAPEAAAAGIDLQLSGHTHGGQVRLPLYGALITSSIYGKRFEMGKYHLPKNDGGTMTLYTSRGIGVEGGIAPRARFLCRPEITLWTLSGPPAKDSHP